MIPRNNPILRHERMMMEGGMGNPVNAGAANFVAATSGNWSAPATWVGGVVPTLDAKVHIPLGKRVVYDLTSASPVRLLWIHVDGALVWATNVATHMLIDTIQTSMSSYLEIGNPTAPATATITFVSDTDLLDKWLPGSNNTVEGDQMSRGLITSGRVMIHGKKKVPYVMLPESVPSTSTSVTIPNQYDPLTGAERYLGASADPTKQALFGWEVGDQIVFPKNRVGSSTEVRTIQSVDPATGVVTWATGLTSNHTGYGNRTPPKQTVVHRHNGYLVNETRSITFKSADKNGVRGHIMFMHGKQVRNTDKIFRREDHKYVPTLAEMGDNADIGVDVYYAASVDMGRTRTILSPRIGAAGNKVGRYSWHWHRVGHWSQKPADAKGLVAVGNVGWQYVRHDCNVHVDFCTGRGLNGETASAGASARGGGAIFLDEEDTEVSPWTRCIAMECWSDVTTNAWGDVDAYNNEYDFNGHGHFGDGFAVNRNSALRECISLNCQHGIQIHPNQTNTRTPHKNRIAYPEDRRPDWHGIKRWGFMSNAAMMGHNVDHQPAGWYACQAYVCRTAFKVDHRQRGAPIGDMMVKIHHCTGTDLATRNSSTANGTWLWTFNYTHNYLALHNSVVNATHVWHQGDKMWGFVFSRNIFENMADGIAGFNPLKADGTSHDNADDNTNIKGGWVDNIISSPKYDTTARKWTYKQAGPGTTDHLHGMDLTNYDSTNWPAYTFGVTLTVTNNNTRKPIITGSVTDGLVDRIPFIPSSWTAGIQGITSGMGPLPIGISHRAGSDTTLNYVIQQAGGANSEDTNRKLTMTLEEMIETWGAVSNGAGGYNLILWFPFRDRLNGAMRWAQATITIPTALHSLAAMHVVSSTVANAEPHAITSENVTPGFLADPAPATYAVFPDPTHPILYVIKGNKLQVDATEAFLSLAHGSPVNFSRTFTFAGGATQTINFAVVGRALAPGMDPDRRPRISLMSTPFAVIQKGANTWASRFVYFDKGRALGWPYPWAETTFQRSPTGGTSGWVDAINADSRFEKWGLKDAFMTRTRSLGQSGDGTKYETVSWNGIMEGHYRLAVTMENTMGSHGVNYSNLLQITTDGSDTAGTTAHGMAVPANPTYPTTGGSSDPNDTTVVAIPTGYERPGDFTWGYGWRASSDIGLLCNWWNGAGTYQVPEQVTFLPNKNALMTLKWGTASYHKDGSGNLIPVPISGTMQITSRDRSQGRWGVYARCRNPKAVAAFFLYQYDKNHVGNRRAVELDFEYIGNEAGGIDVSPRTKPGWALNVHMPKIDGTNNYGNSTTAQTSSQRPFVAMSQAEVMNWHRYEFEFLSDRVNFYIDDMVTPKWTILASNMPSDTTWTTTWPMQPFFSCEAHGSWAGWGTFNSSYPYPADWEVAGFRC